MIADTTHNFLHCAACEFRSRDALPVCLRHPEKKKVFELVQASACPEDRFGKPLPIAIEPAQAPPARPYIPQPGDMVAMLLQSLGFAKHASCGCEGMKGRMNRLGWLGCWRQRDELVAWFVEQARKVNVEVKRENVLGLFRAALFELWRRRINQGSRPD